MKNESKYAYRYDVTKDADRWIVTLYNEGQEIDGFSAKTKLEAHSLAKQKWPHAQEYHAASDAEYYSEEGRRWRASNKGNLA